jgi:hypothetical protein
MLILIMIMIFIICISISIFSIIHYYHPKLIIHHKGAPSQAYVHDEL